MFFAQNRNLHFTFLSFACVTLIKFYEYIFISEYNEDLPSRVRRPGNANNNGVRNTCVIGLPLLLTLTLSVVIFSLTV